ncbi:hypothetical protein ACIRJR_30615 [Streptomyces sp. NPDC102402]|uniref:hypothetical protein n=1 Tax=Streptomyces sp. NPDC102402 TaxID=3366169 RepID=UPI00381376F9
MKPGRCSRAVRAALFAAVCALLAATGHALMSGTPVSGRAMSVALVATAAAAWALAGRERGLLAVTSAAVVAQTALHTGFTLAQSLTRPAPGAREVSYARQWAGKLLCGDGAATLSDREAARIVTDAGLGGLISRPPPGVSPVASAEAGSHSTHTTHGTTAEAVAGMDPAAHAGQDMAFMPSAGMLAAHLLAAVVCGLWLAYGERALFRVLGTFATRLWTPLQLLLRLSAPPRLPRPCVRRRRTRHAPARLLLVHSITSRGPPTGTAVA